MRPVIRYSFEYTGFDGMFCVVIKYWRLSIKQALAKFKYTHRFHTMRNLTMYTQDN